MRLMIELVSGLATAAIVVLHLWDEFGIFSRETKVQNW